MNIQLTNGTATLRDVEAVTRKERNDLLRSIDAQGKLTIADGKLAPKDAASFDDAIAATDAFTAFLITEWTLDLPLPSEDVTVLDRLTAIDAAKLEQATSDAIVILMPNPDAPPTQPPSPT